MDKSQQIHDMIQTFSISGHPELMVSRVLDILDAINRRMDEIESAAKNAQRTATSASYQPVVIPPFCPHCKGALKYAGNDDGYYYGCFNRCPRQPTSRCMKTKQAAYDDYHGLAG